MTDVPEEREVPEGEFPRWASVAMLDALREIQRLTAYDYSDQVGLLYLTARQAVTQVEKALARLPLDQEVGSSPPASDNQPFSLRAVDAALTNWSGPRLLSRV